MKTYFEHRVPGTKYPVLLFFFLVASAAYADVIYDHSGGTLKGLVVEEHADRIVLSAEQGEQTVFRSQIEEVFYAEPERNYLYLGGQALESGDFGAARGFFQKALQINSVFSEAADAIERAADLEKKQDWVSQGLDLLQALEKQWGITLAQGKELAVVQEVRPGSLAERSGLAAGDGLVAAWNVSLAFIPAGAVARELIGPPGSISKLTIQRAVELPAGGRLEMKLSMERLGLTAAGEAPGLLPGDRIISIGGKPTRYMPLGDARGMIQSAKEGVELLIHRDLKAERE
jgi:hypothetical protein